METLLVYFFFILILGKDPYTQTEYLLSLKGLLFPLPIKLIFLLLRLSVCFVCLQISRVITLVVCVPTITAYLVLSSISCLDRSAVTCMTNQSRTMTKIYFRYYATMQIIMAIGYDFIAPAISVCMFISFILSVLLNTMSLELYGVVDMPYFLVFPIIATVLEVIIHIMLRMMVDLSENCGKTQINWARLLRLSNDKKYLKRRLSSLQCIAVCGGILSYNLYLCKRSIKGTYFGAILNYTITSVLSINIEA